MRFADLMKNCPVCSSSKTDDFDVEGFVNLWSSDLSCSSGFKFLRCLDCGYVWNADYGGFSFVPDSYDNFTPVSNSDSSEKLLARKIFHSLIALNKTSRHLNIAEVGSGKRLGMLRELSELLPDASVYAVDPVLQEQRLYVSDTKYISLARDVLDIDFPLQSVNVLVFRNSLEYFSPSDLATIFARFFKEGGMLVAEMTSLDVSMQGYCHVFSEYLNFYKPQHLFGILSKCGIKSIPIQSSSLHGDDRILLYINVLPASEASKTLLFGSVFDLILSLEKHAADSNLKTVMYGAGGRNIMALVNHFENKVDAVYDSDPRRSSSVLPFSIPFVDRGSVKISSPIVLLNSSFLSAARYLFPENLFFVLAPS